MVSFAAETQVRILINPPDQPSCWSVSLRDSGSGVSSSGDPQDRGSLLDSEQRTVRVKYGPDVDGRALGPILGGTNNPCSDWPILHKVPLR